MSEKQWFWCVTCAIATTGPRNDQCSLVGPYATALEAFEWAGRAPLGEPPPHFQENTETLSKWLNYEGVSTADLVAEMQLWLDYFRRLGDDT